MHNITTNASFAYFPIKDQPVGFRVAFGIIAFLSFTSNGLLVIFFMRTYKEVIKTPYSVFILSLAITDMATGVGLVLVPSLIVGSENFHVPSGLAGDIFCRVFGSGYWVFTLGVVSSFTITSLALERWFAVAQPAKYKASFKKSRMFVMLTLVWFCPFTFNSTAMFLTTIGPDKKCVWFKSLSIGKTLNRVLGVISFTAMFLIPLMITFSALIKIYLKVRHSQALFKTNQGRAGIRLVRMFAVAAVALAVCWLPNQASFLLSKFLLIERDKAFHNFTRILCMSNSFVNPFIYFATNKSYRHNFLKTVCPCRGTTRIIEPLHVKAIESNTNSSIALKVVRTHDQGSKKQLVNVLIDIESKQM